MDDNSKSITEVMNTGYGSMQCIAHHYVIRNI